MEIYDELIEGRTHAPTFYTDFPTGVLAADPRHRKKIHSCPNGGIWSTFAAEIGAAYSELIDPVDQREQAHRQSLLAAAGDPEAMQIDESFLTALEYAMPRPVDSASASTGSS